jgi:hypothetical protein
MTIRIEKYNPPPEMIQGFLSLMNILSNDIRKKTSAPEGACAMAAVTVMDGLLDAVKSELQVAVLPDPDLETKH